MMSTPKARPPYPLPVAGSTPGHRSGGRSGLQSPPTMPPVNLWIIRQALALCLWLALAPLKPFANTEDPDS